MIAAAGRREAASRTAVGSRPIGAPLSLCAQVARSAVAQLELLFDMPSRASRGEVMKLAFVTPGLVPGVQ